MTGSTEPGGWTTVRIPIDGLRCLSCVLHLESALDEVPGVLSASVDIADRAATVLCRPGAISRADLARAIEAAGYRVPASAIGEGTKT
jgi:copper chaperone CopZ